MTSMTGHGRGEARTKTWTAVVECFSVNRKTAEIVFHAERGAAWLEPVVRERALARVARGRVQVNL
ncbi:MAG: YicC/YloC family endoribonuclease, partial [Verrucomicrobiota bacterium]